MKVKLVSFFSLLMFFPLLSFSNIPKINYNLILFSYKNVNAKEVKLLFSFDNYKKNYHMSRLNDGNFILNLTKENIGGTLKEGDYYYRVIVDGVYTYDISNPNFIIDPYLGRLSMFSLDTLFISSQNGPVKMNGNIYRFFYRATSFQNQINNVMLVGNFNNWQTFQHILKQSDKDSRIWFIDVPLEAVSQVQYMFVVDGEWVKDINNSMQGRNKAGQEVSLFHVKR